MCLKFSRPQVIFTRYLRRFLSCLGCRKQQSRLNVPAMSADLRWRRHNQPAIGLEWRCSRHIYLHSLSNGADVSEIVHTYHRMAPKGHQICLHSIGVALTSPNLPAFAIEWRWSRQIWPRSVCSGSAIATSARSGIDAGFLCQIQHLGRHLGENQSCHEDEIWWYVKYFIWKLCYFVINGSEAIQYVTALLYDVYITVAVVTLWFWSEWCCWAPLFKCDHKLHPLL